MNSVFSDLWDIVVIVVLLGCAVKVGYAILLKPRYIARVSKEWPETYARIERHVAVPRNGGKSGGWTEWIVPYSYQLAGEYYSGEISLDVGSNPLKEEYPAGRKILVRYNPCDPAVSVIAKSAKIE